MAITTQILDRNNLVTSGIPQTVSFVNNSFTSDTNGGVQFPLQQGVPMQAIYRFKVIPAAVDNTCIAQPHTFGSAGFVTFNAASTPAPSGDIPYCTNVIYYKGQVINLPINPNFTGGNGCLKLDCERTICFNWGGATTNNFSITIAGWDYRGTAVCETLSYTSGSPADGETYSTKAYSIIGYIYVSGAPGNAFSVGTEFDFGTPESGGIGLPYFAVNTTDIIMITWGGAVLDETNPDDFTPGHSWREASPSLTSGPSRGVVTVSSPPDGVTALCVTYFAYGADSETNANLQNLVPSTVVDYKIQENVSGNPVFPYLTPYDLVGMQYPGNMDAYQVYADALLV